MTIGVVGAGQLGRMLALAGMPLGQDFLFLDRDAATPAGQIAPILTGEFTDARLLGQLLRRAAVVTFDWENISVQALRAAARGHAARIAPPLRALGIAQDRLREKRFFERAGIPTTAYAAVDSLRALERAVAKVGLPGVLKTRRMGYDGKGQAVLRRPADLAPAFAALGGHGLLYEEFVRFDFEVSALGVRGRDGQCAYYPLCRNLHADGVLRLTRAPWPAPVLERAARAYLATALRELKYCGVLALEFFVRRGQLIANEMAPRVHNSGHWTIEGAATSQFENHLRAILGLPLGLTAARGHSAMINLLGRVPPAQGLLVHPGVHLHDYAKTPRARRKVGHLTVVASSAQARDRQARQLLRQLYPDLRAIP